MSDPGFSFFVENTCPPLINKEKNFFLVFSSITTISDGLLLDFLELDSSSSIPFLISLSTLSTIVSPLFSHHSPLS